MTPLRTLEILSHDFDVPVNFYPIPLVAAASLDSTVWAQSVVDDVGAAAINPGVPGVLVKELAELRTRLLGQRNPWLTAAVSIRPEAVLSIGCVLQSQQLAMDPDDGPDAFEQVIRDGSTAMRPGVRSRDLEVWRDTIPAGELVGVFQRMEFIELHEMLGGVSERTVFGIFPKDSSDMIQMTFTSEDFGAFADIRAETQEIVATLRVETGQR